MYKVTDPQETFAWTGFLSELMESNEMSDFTVERARRLEPGDFIRLPNADGELIWKITRVE